MLAISLWSDQVVDGNDPLQNETVEKCRNGDGFTCAGLQYDPCHEHRGHSCDDPGDEGVSGLMRLQYSTEMSECALCRPERQEDPSE